MGPQVHTKFQRNRPSRYRHTAGGTFVTPFIQAAPPRATMGTDMVRHWSHIRHGNGVTHQRRPLVNRAYGSRDISLSKSLILRFLVYISRNSLHASRSLVTSKTPCLAMNERARKRYVCFWCGFRRRAQRFSRQRNWSRTCESAVIPPPTFVNLVTIGSLATYRRFG